MMPFHRFRVFTMLVVVLLLAIPQTVQAIEAAGLWNLDDYLKNPPKVTLGEPAGPLVREVYYEGELFHGKPTRVFAYLGVPEGQGPFDGKFPAILLIHGGGGKAFANWAELWAQRGYVALAMDLAGHGPKGRLSDGGPNQDDTGKLRDFSIDDGDYRNMWTYQSIAAILRGHALLAARDDVDPDRIAATGISWGGYLTCILAGVDHRLRAIVPVYGCGFLYENGLLMGRLDKMTPEHRERWISLFDPSKHVNRAQMPMLFVNGTNDFAFPLDSYEKTCRLPKGEVAISVTLRRPHSHIFTFKEVDVFIDNIILAGTPANVEPLPKLSATKISDDGKTVSAVFESKVPIDKAELAFTTDSGKWQQRQWKTVPAAITGNTISADLPEPTPTCYYILVTDQRGLPVSTPIVIPSP